MTTERRWGPGPGPAPDSSQTPDSSRPAEPGPGPEPGRTPEPGPGPGRGPEAGREPEPSPGPEPGREPGPGRGPEASRGSEPNRTPELSRPPEPERGPGPNRTPEPNRPPQQSRRLEPSRPPEPNPLPKPSLFAREYARLAPQMDARGVALHRAELVAGLAGTVVEVGCGPGGMFAHYPASVRSVLAVEPDAYLRGLAEGAARPFTSPRITVVDAHADALPAEAGSVDAVVFSLVLCSVPDVDDALAEAKRVLRPGGEFRFYEHVRSASAVMGLLEDVVTPVWRLAAGNCHPNRNTVALIERAGFRIDVARRFGFSPAPIAPSIAHVIGRASLA